MLQQDEPVTVTAAEEAPPPARPAVEVGWVLAGAFDKDQLKAIRRARGVWAGRMREAFGGFDWRVPMVRVPAAVVSGADGAAVVEPVALLDVAVQERDARRWDMAVAFTAADLRTYEKPAALGAPAAAIACAVAGVSRLAPDRGRDDDDTAADGPPSAGKGDVALLSRRVVALVAHLVGHLGGLRHSDDPQSFMHRPDGPADLDLPDHYDAEERRVFARELEDVADPRLEERGGRRRAQRRGRAAALGFALRAAWGDRDDVLRAVWKAQPWMIPVRLSRLTTAAASTLVVLILTAEAWEAGMSQPLWRVALMSLASLVITSAYLIRRQRLLVGSSRRRSARLSEQRSIGNVAITLAVGLGLLTTYAGLFAATFLAAWVFYPPGLVRNWAASVAEPLDAVHYLRLSGSIASLGLTIGALGASFEPRGYVRHVAYVDEET